MQFVPARNPVKYIALNVRHKKNENKKRRKMKRRGCGVLMVEVASGQ